MLGGSILKAVKKRLPKCEVRIWARRFEALHHPVIRELADFAGTDVVSVVGGAELVILAPPVQHMAGLVQEFPRLKRGAVVTDVGSTKVSVVQALKRTVEQKGGCFVGSHPMAGSEKTGINHSSEMLFENAAVIVTPEENQEHSPEVLQVAAFWKALGGVVTFLSPARHDEIVASISHLPHLVAAALARRALTNRGENASLAGGGFRDTTRIASGDPAMWTGIMAANQEALISELGALIAELKHWQDALAARDEAELFRLLSLAKECRDLV